MGTAFKPNTDDVRDSLSIELIRKFLKMKAKIIVYDPRAINNTKKIFGTKIIYKNSVSEALEKSECVIFMTYWKEFENIDNRTIKHMKRKLIIDCRRIFADKNMGKEYFALGIGQ
jgi:UDPglucose 6-dehydrogenase